MKTTLRTPAVILILISTATATLAQSASSAASAVNPATGLPVSRSATAMNPTTGLPIAQPASHSTPWAHSAPPAAPITIDPKTGLPMVPPAPQWKDPDWRDPAKVLPDVHFDNVPISYVVQYLRGQYSNDFDIVIPSGYHSKSPPPVSIDPNTGLPVGQPPTETIDPDQYVVKLQLRNVTASEVFNAMNLEFEVENTPLQWHLTMNGTRPTAVLHVVPGLLPPAPPPTEAAPELKRMVFFVGNLIGDEKAGGMTMKQIGQTISQVWAKAYDQTGTVQFYEPAQLLIVTGSPDQIDFIQQTLSALRQKVELAQREHPESDAATSKTSQPKSGASAGSK